MTLLLSGIIAQHRAAQRAARETPASRLRGSALNASQNELFKHPTSSSDPSRATQNTFLPCGSTPGAALNSLCQLLDASLSPAHLLQIQGWWW